jgi:serine/threonine protein phosphatase PrpC
MPAIPLVFHHAAASRPAPHHEKNEDAWMAHLLSGEAGGLFVVCDGVSTAREGSAAAWLACRRLGEFTEPGGRRTPTGLVQLVSEIDWELRGSGRQARCTLAMAWVEAATAEIVCVGDSPIFRLRGGRVRQAGTEKTGTFKRLQASVGMGPAVQDALFREKWDLFPGDVLFLVSDGVVEALDESDLARLWDRTREPERCVRAVLDEVARTGVDDDATVVVVEVRERVGPPPSLGPDEAPDPPARLRTGPKRED